MIYEVPVSHRPGRRFEPTEERLLDRDLVVLASHLPGASESLYLSREVVGPRGIADLVATTRAEPGLRIRQELGLAPLTNPSDVAVVAATKARRTLTVASIALHLGLSTEQVVRRAASLVSRGYLIRVGNGIRRAEGISPLGRAYALEAKVNDWQKGLSQALRYGAWCDATAVALLRPPRDLTEVRRRYEHFGVGLAVRDRWLIRPRLGRPQPAMRLLASEAWLENLTQSPSPTAYASSTFSGFSTHMAF